VPVKEWVNLLVNLPKEAAEGTTFTKEKIEAILGGNAQRILNL